MDRETAHKLIEETSAFYAANAESFSSTRERPWDGWSHVLGLAAPATKQAVEEGIPFRVLDVGSGNMRFEKMLVNEFPDARFEFFGVDNCAALACGFAQEANVRFQTLDVIACLEGGALEGKIDAPPCDLVVAFGFMHHIPQPEWREVLLRALIQHTKPGGLIAITFWQFANNAKMAHKATETTAIGCAQLGIQLDQQSGDFLLGWQDGLERFRYCHSFADEEIIALEQVASASGATPLAAFSADGPDGKSNRYLVLKA